MKFSQKKFCSLTIKQRAKKITELIREMIFISPPGWQKQLVEYNNLCKWSEEPNQILATNCLRYQEIIGKYEYWRVKAELGADMEIYSRLTFFDREEALAKKINWTVLLHNLRSGYNVGSIIRSCDCMGLESINLSGYTAKSNNKSVKSSAMGSEAWSEIKHWDSPFECIQNYKDLGYTIVALETAEDAPTVDDYDWPEKGLIIVGNEELGIPEELLKVIDQVVTIPMYGRKGSMNVANAFAISSYNLTRCIRKPY